MRFEPETDSDVNATMGPDDLARSFLPILERLSKRLTRDRPSQCDEAYSAGLLGLAEASMTYNPSQGPFTPYAARLSCRAIFDNFEHNRPLGYRGKQYRYDASDNIPLTSAFGPVDPADNNSPGPVGWDVDFHDWVAGLSRTLPVAHGDALRSLYLDADAISVYACAVRMGASPSRVSKLHDEALAMLRDNHGVDPVDRPTIPVEPGGSFVREVSLVALSGMVADGQEITAKTLAARSGLPIGTARICRRKLIASGEWPGTDSMVSDPACRLTTSTE